MTRWGWAVAFVPILAVLGWWWATYGQPQIGTAPAPSPPAAEAPIGGSAPTWADLKRRQEAERGVLDLVRALVESQKQTASGLVTLRQDLQAVRGELQDLKGATAERPRRGKPRAVRKRPARPTASAPSPTWRWW